ncbi:MAG TPA: GNAT family N-acetyltransferase [Candidatus Nanoarchaeia archaeon]|nr:GNAT family N-acetyltransferase [Candidatus Nanoarchaeia archaeon]
MMCVAALKSLWCDSLRRLPFYDDSFDVDVRSSGSVSSWYADLIYRHPLFIRSEHQDGTLVVATVAEGLGFIDSFQVKAGERRRGHGRLLYETVEQVMVAFGCQNIQLSASFHARPFWERMGFRYKNGNQLYEKVL